jgi:4-amino-4-deoxy-L-arabinose transferase-like glycosyltransferase
MPLRMFQTNINWTKATPLLFVLVNVVLKLLFLTSNSLGGDEPFSVYHAQLPMSSFIEMLYTENNPPFHFIVLHFWIKVFGISELSARIPSLLASCLSVYVIFKIGQRYFNFPIALVSSLLFTLSNYHMGFAHEARVYPFFALFASLSMYFLLQLLNEAANKKTQVFFILTNALILYSHYLGFIFILTQLLIVLSLRCSWASLKAIIGYGVILFLLYLPNLHIFYIRLIRSKEKGTWVMPPNGLKNLYTMIWHFSNMPLPAIACIAVLVLALLKFILKKDYQNLRFNSKVILIWFLFPFLFMFGISYLMPVFLDRYLVFVSIAFYFSVAIASLYLIDQKKIQWVVPGLLVLLFGFTFNPKVDNKRHMKDAVQKVKELKNDSTMVIHFPHYNNHHFTYYYNRNYFKQINAEFPYYQSMMASLNQENVFSTNRLEDVDFKNFKRIIYFDAHSSPTSNSDRILEALHAKYQLKASYEFYEALWVYEFESPKAPQ